MDFDDNSLHKKICKSVAAKSFGAPEGAVWAKSLRSREQ
jgi:hypothetical protein